MVLRPDSWSNWNLEMLGFDREWKTVEYGVRITSWSKGDNQNQTQPTYGIDAAMSLS